MLRLRYLEHRYGNWGEIVLLELEAATGTISTVQTSKHLGVAQRLSNNVSKAQIKCQS